MTRFVRLLTLVCFAVFGLPGAVSGATIDSFTPISGWPGTTVTITGSGFTGSTAVFFHRTEATGFSILSDTQIRTTVPPAACNGPIRIDTPSGQVFSADWFVVEGPPLDPPVIQSNSPVCEGLDLEMSTAYIEHATYSWTGPGGFTADTKRVTVPSWQVRTGAYSVTLTLLGRGSATGSTDVVVKGRMKTPVATSNSPVCEGALIRLSTPTVQGAEYHWSSHTYGDINVQNPTVVAGPYLVGQPPIKLWGHEFSVHLTHPDWCPSYAGTTFVGVIQKPSISTPDTVRPGVPAQATASPPGTGYAWEISGGVITAGAAAETVTFVPGPSGVVSLKVTSSICNASASASVAIVPAKVASSVTLTSSANPVTYGQVVTLTASVTAGATGTVTFRRGGFLLRIEPLSQAAASITTLLGGGTHAITAEYGGDDAFLAANSSVLSQIVERTTPIVDVATSSSFSLPGTPLTITASLPADATGLVSFKDGRTTLARYAANAGRASLTTSALARGEHAINAYYEGDDNYHPAGSIVLTHFVTDLTITGISPSVSSSAGNTSVTLYGSGFKQGAVVMIGGSPARDVVVPRPDALEFKTPSHPPGVVDVSVINLDGEMFMLPGGLTYVSQVFDPNGDGLLDSADLTTLVNAVFGGSAAHRTNDANGDGLLTPADVVFLAHFLFRGGPAPSSTAPGGTGIAATVEAPLAGAMTLGVPVLQHGDTFLVPVTVSLPAESSRTPQAWSIQVRAEGVAPLGILRVRRAAGLDILPVYEAERATGASASYLVLLDEPEASRIFTPGRKAVVAEIEVKSHPGFLRLNLDASTTMLMDGLGTTAASQASGTLVLTGVTVRNEGSRRRAVAH